MPKAQERTAVYAGSFDPITLGHLNIIERAVAVVDRLVVAIGVNAGKASLFTPEERVNMVREATRKFPTVEVGQFDGLAVQFVRSLGAHLLVRGVRPLQDLEAEMTMMLANRQLDPGIDTIVLMADREFAHISSSLIKQIAPIAGDDELALFVPREVIAPLRAKIGPGQAFDARL